MQVYFGEGSTPFVRLLRSPSWMWTSSPPQKAKLFCTSPRQTLRLQATCFGFKSIEIALGHVTRGIFAFSKNHVAAIPTRALSQFWRKKRKHRIFEYWLSSARYIPVSQALASWFVCLIFFFISASFFWKEPLVFVTLPIFAWASPLRNNRKETP